MRFAILLGCALVMLSGVIRAQEGSTQPSALDWWINNAAVDLAVPTSPAFAVLDVTPETIVRPESPRNLAVGLLSGIDPRGNLQTGLAVDTAPYMLFAGNDVTLRQYQSSYFIRQLARTQISLATAKGASDDDDATRLGAGFRLTLWDESDARLDERLLTCFGSKWEADKADREALQDKFTELKIQEAQGHDVTQELAQIETRRLELEESLKTGVRSCRSDPEVRGSLWNNSGWSIGFAPTWTAKDGAFDDLDWSGFGFWTTLGYGFEGIPGLEDNAEVLAHGRIRTDELVPDDNGTFFEQDEFTVGTQARVAGPDIGDQTLGGPDLSFFADIAYIDRQRHGRDNEDVFRYGFGAEYRLSDSLYLQLSLGSETGGEEDDSFLLGNLKWSFATEPELREAVRQ